VDPCADGLEDTQSGMQEMILVLATRYCFMYLKTDAAIGYMYCNRREEKRLLLPVFCVK
jgi:hypothetical protein